MSRNVAYAELQFVRTPLENGPQPLQEGPAGGDLTYENIQAATPQEATPPNSSKWHKGPKRPFWPITWGLLGATLFLLATTVGFGVRYRQVSWQLQEALATSAAESRALIDAQERDLVKMQRRLREAEAELRRGQTVLQESWRLVNGTREQLQKQQEMLTTEVQERRAVEEALNATLANACAGWCPEEAWLLYGGKCLFFSTQEKKWAESSGDCQKRAAQLLAVTSKHPAEIPKPLESNVYWIGNNSTWTEENGVHTPHRESRHPKCATLKAGKRAQDSCQLKHRYICEQPATPPAPAGLLRRLAGDPEAASPA